jgi:hypothetical protein
MEYATTHHELTIEWEYTVSPGYPATRIDPPEPPSLEVKRAFVNIAGRRYPAPDWLVEELLTETTEAELIEAAQEARADAIADYADSRRDDAA